MPQAARRTAASAITHSLPRPETAARNCDARASSEPESFDAILLLYHRNPGLAAPRPHRGEFRPDERLRARDLFQHVAGLVAHRGRTNKGAPGARSPRGAGTAEGRRPTCQPFGWIRR